MYEHSPTHYAYLIFMIISERLSRFDHEIHEIGQQECITVDEDVASY
jgi:hypothetical protein